MIEEEPHIHNDLVEELESMKVAVVLNSVIAIGSLASAVVTGSHSALSETIHDSTDAVTHGLDRAGYATESIERSILLRRAAAIGILASSAYFSYRFGVEMLQVNDEPTTNVAVAVAAGAAGVNQVIHSRLHTHNHDEKRPHLEASKVHAHVDRWVSLGLLAGIATSRFTDFTNAEDITAWGGAVITFFGNLKPSVKAFLPRKRAHAA